MHKITLKWILSNEMEGAGGEICVRFLVAENKKTESSPGRSGSFEDYKKYKPRLTTIPLKMSMNTQ